MYRYQLQGYAKLIGVLKVVVYALLLNGISSSTSIAQVSAPAVPAVQYNFCHTVVISQSMQKCVRSSWPQKHLLSSTGLVDLHVVPKICVIA